MINVTYNKMGKYPKMSELEQRIRRNFLDSRRLYGSRKFKEALEQQRVYVTGKTVEEAS